MPRIADTIYAFRFLRLLTMPWEKTEAYKRGIIDDKGKVLKKGLTMQDDKAAYTIFHKLVFNIRKMIERIGGASRIANYASALFLVKEHAGLTEKDFKEVFAEAYAELDANTGLSESWMVSGDTLGVGRYILTTDIASPTTGELIAKEKSSIIVSENCDPVDTLFGTHIYEVLHEKTKQKIYVTVADIKR